MKIAVFGLGYVGVVSAACLAKEGHDVVGVDVDARKVDMIGGGKSPVIEDKIDDVLAEVVRSGALKTTINAAEAVQATDVSIICVGTPSLANGDVELQFLRRVTEQIAQAIKTRTEEYTIVYRSTMPPGTTEKVLVPILEEVSGRRAGRHFHVAFNPEFLREGASVSDFYDPPMTVVGTGSETAAVVVRDIYAFLSTPVEVTSIKVAELLKYACNTYHALKITFANEMGNVARLLGVDGVELMRLFSADTKLNVSSMYLRPGFAYGGSCLPKDLRALLYLTKTLDYDASLLAAIPRSNESQIDEGFRMIASFRKRRIGMLGLAFKPGTDDLRESPLVRLSERLIGKGYQLRIYDKHVSLSRLFGTNRAFIEREIPHIEELFVETIDEVVDHSDVIVVGNRDPEYVDVVERTDRGEIVDLARVMDDPSALSRYRGICW